MSILHADIAGHEQLLPEIHSRAHRTLQTYNAHRSLLRFLDTRQKWLLLHVISSACGQETTRLDRQVTCNRICDEAAALGIASRNTALGFIDQLVAYRHLIKRDCPADRRMKLLSLAPSTIAALADLTRLALDDDENLQADEQAFSIHRDAIQTLLAEPKWVNPPLDIRLTHDTRGGWLLMQVILARLAPPADGWLRVEAFNVPDVSRQLSLSRSTVYRLLRMAIDAGIMRWSSLATGCGLEVSHYHLMQYMRWNSRLTAAYRLASAKINLLPNTDTASLFSIDRQPTQRLLAAHS